MQSNLIAQLSEKDKMLEKQQNELNEARVQIAKLHGEIEAVRKERKALEEQVKNAVRAEPDTAAEPKEPEKEKEKEKQQILLPDFKITQIKKRLDARKYLIAF